MIKKEEVQHIAKLARINLTEKETEKFKKDLSSILGYFELLKEVDTKKVKPTFHPAEDCLKENAVRQDRAEMDNIADNLIELAPAQKERRIKVKSIF